MGKFDSRPEIFFSIEGTRMIMNGAHKYIGKALITALMRAQASPCPWNTWTILDSHPDEWHDILNEMLSKNMVGQVVPNEFQLTNEGFVVSLLAQSSCGLETLFRLKTNSNCRHVSVEIDGLV